MAFKRSGENAFLTATIFTSWLSVPKISTVPSIARSENVPEGSSGNLLSTPFSSTWPAKISLPKSIPQIKEITADEFFFYTQYHNCITYLGADDRPHIISQ